MTLYPSTPQTTAIYRDFKKSTAISKGYNVGLRYIKILKAREKQERDDGKTKDGGREREVDDC
jgi:hypothetical protein